MLVLFGIKNCDTVKKARQWLEQHGIPYRFHDFRDDGLSSAQVDHFFTQCDWEVLLNRRSTTWKTLGDSQSLAVNAQSVAALLLQNPTLIKRPVLDNGEGVLVGFNVAAYQNLLLPKS